jgi:hypothetical protein
MTATWTAIAGAALITSTLLADEWLEKDDAGGLPGTAQKASGPPGARLSKVKGVLTGPGLAAGETDLEDMFLVTVLNVDVFLAGLEAAATNFDTQLFIFAADGHDADFAYGSLANDDANTGTQLSRLIPTATDGTGWVIPGQGSYFLAISGYPRVPFILSDSGSPMEIFKFDGGTEVSGPDGPAGAFANPPFGLQFDDNGVWCGDGSDPGCDDGDWGDYEMALFGMGYTWDPGNDTCAEAQSLGASPSVDVMVDNRTAMTDIPNLDSCPTPDGRIYHDLWYRWQAPCSGQLYIDGCDTSYRNAIAFYETSDGSCDSLSLIKCDSGNCGNGTHMEMGVIDGMTYYIQIGSVEQFVRGETFLHLNIDCGTPSNDFCSGATEVFDGDTEDDNRDATTDGPSHNECAGTGSVRALDDLWYEWTATCTGSLEVCINASFAPAVFIYDNCNDMSLLACDGSLVCGGEYETGATTTVIEGQTYIIRVGGAAGEESGVFVINITCVGDEPPVDPCPADVNNDGVVNVLDLLLLIEQWGQSGAQADINGDGTVNIQDLLVLIDAWGPCDGNTSCVCNEIFDVGQTVWALYDGVSGNTQIHAGDAGTVVCGRISGGGDYDLLLVEWDITNGHDGHDKCDCPDGAVSEDPRGWYVYCGEVTSEPPATTACACNEIYTVGDIVYAQWDGLSGNDQINAGDAGVVICGREYGDGDYDLLLVEWEITNGHDGLDACECPADNESDAPKGWYVYCGEVAAEPPACTTGLSCGDAVPWCTDDNSCFCGTGYDGGLFCVPAATCSSVESCPDGNCPAGMTCIVDTCCDDPICLPDCGAGATTPVGPPGTVVRRPALTD